MLFLIQDFEDYNMLLTGAPKASIDALFKGVGKARKKRLAENSLKPSQELNQFSS